MIPGMREQDYILQVAEECGELIQACAKVKRVINGRNYTPVSLEQAKGSANDELVDVELCIEQTMLLWEVSPETMEDIVEEEMKSLEERVTWEAVGYAAAKLAEDSLNLASKIEKTGSAGKDARYWITSAVEMLATEKKAVTEFGLPKTAMESYKRYKLRRWIKRQEQSNA